MAEDEPDRSSGRSAHADGLWADVRIDPVEIALPSGSGGAGGVGYTLRAYRPLAELRAPESARQPQLDEFDAAAAAVARHRRAGSEEDERGGARRDDRADEFDEAREGLDDDLGDEGPADEEEVEEEEVPDDASRDEEVPVFLGRNGRFYLFHSADKLVEFIRCGAEHDLSQLDTWPDLVDRVSAEDVVALDEDSYELDLVVPNLRGGPDAWDPTLVLKAGEITRDLGYALRLEPVVVALAPGSPLDDLDNALRAVDAGGLRALLARLKIRKIPVQQSALAWRTLIGKISAAADWRD